MTFQGIGLGREKDLRKRMRRMGVFEKDLTERFVRSSGSGGQNVNKVATCVYLHHEPTDTSVKCQTERTQGQNRYMARQILLNKIGKQRKEATFQKKQQLEKRRRQTRKRPLGLKEGYLQEKHLRSEKKESRRKVDIRRLDQMM